MKLAVESLADLTGKPHPVVLGRLKTAGFVCHSTTVGGYTLFRHPDGSELWIRPSGEIVRLGPKIMTTDKSRMYRPRYDQHGNRTESHNTGEVVQMSESEDDEW